MTITTPTMLVTLSPLHVLQHKKDAELAHGAFTRYELIDPKNRSHYSPAAPSIVELGLGYVQAVLAILHGIVSSFSYDAPGLVGRVVAHSANRSSCYQFTWHQESDRFLMGGFVHSRGQPTYQAAIIALVQAIAAYRSGDIMQNLELVERWYGLIGEMERIYPRHDITVGWERSTLAAACKHSTVRPHLIQVCDALRIVMTYRLYDHTSREPGVTAHDVISREIGTSILAPGALLLNPAGVAAGEATVAPTATPGTPAPVTSEANPPASAPAATPVASPAPASTPTPASASTTSEAATPTATLAPKPARKPRTRSAPKAAPATAEPPKPAPVTTPPVFGPHLRRIELALKRGGPVMLVGPTATGKTTQAMTASMTLGFGIEPITIDAGWEADDLFGAFTRAKGDTDWAFVPGPVIRWVERALAGEQVVLLIDELARGHRTVISAIMRLLNEYPKPAVLGMKLPIPEGEEGPFHIIDVRATQQRYVVPCHRVRVVATANLGDKYDGLDLSDPAFGRRWSGGWLQLTGYKPDEAAKILGDRLGLAPTAPLIRAMLRVELQILDYQRKEDILRATLDLATLIAWGRTTLALHTSAPDAAKGNPQRAFLDAARDTWLDRICPILGADLDPKVERTLLDIVSASAPAALV
jgi:hypothetical protein